MLWCTQCMLMQWQFAQGPPYGDLTITLFRLAISVEYFQNQLGWLSFWKSEFFIFELYAHCLFTALTIYQFAEMPNFQCSSTNCNSNFLRKGLLLVYYRPFFTNHWLPCLLSTSLDDYQENALLWHFYCLQLAILFPSHFFWQI